MRYTRKNAQLVTTLQQTCSKLVARFIRNACSQLVDKLQQVASNKLGTNWQNNSIATTCWQACYTSLLRTQLVDKMWDFYVCTLSPWAHSTSRSTPHTRKNAQLVTNLQQTCSKLVGTSLLQDLFALLVPSLLTSCYRPAADLLQAWWSQQPCYKLFQQLVIGMQSTTCQQVVSNKVGTTWQNNSIATTCWQACYKLVANTTCWQDVRFLRV